MHAWACRRLPVSAVGVNTLPQGRAGGATSTMAFRPAAVEPGKIERWSLSVMPMRTPRRKPTRSTQQRRT